MAKAESPAEQYDVSERKRESLLGVNYKWIVLLNTTLGALMATIDGSILIISLPAIFKGMGVNPLQGGDTTLLLLLILGYTIVAAVTVVAIGRLSDMYGRVKLYNIGFVIFAISSTAIWISSYLILGTTGILAMIAIRLVQGLGGGFLIGNGAAILTDAFPSNERGRALGINQVAAVGGSLLGLLAGGVLAAIDWHLIFLISVPVGVVGAIWAFYALHELALTQKKQKLDIPGNVTFAASILLILLSLTYGIQPYNGQSMGWSNPIIIGSLVLGILLMIIFVLIESKAEFPMFKLWLFKIRAFTFGNLCLLLGGIARGGLQFMLVIWLQGIWLPLHGVNFEDTPLYAAIDMAPLIVGFLIAGPLSGYLSDKHGPRLFTTVGMLISTVGFLSLAFLPVNFSYPVFAAILFIIGIGNGMFTSPNTAAIMNSVPPEYRGAASGMRATLFNLSLVLSISIFFTLLTVGVSSTLPSALYNGLTSQNVSSTVALQVSKLPPSSALFAALLGYNPMSILLPSSVLSSLPAANRATLLGTTFFPTLISQPFIAGIHLVFFLGALMTFIAAILSFMRGKKFVYSDTEANDPLLKLNTEA